MHKTKYKLSKLAQTHLQKIKSYKHTLLTGFQMLADNPDIGRSCDDIFPNSFYFPVGKHTAYFTKENGFILVVAVLAQSQRPQNHL
jgi:toxin ParE1/3/4